MSSKYTIDQDEFCQFHLKKDGQTVGISFTPYPVIQKAFDEGYMTKEEILVTAAQYQIPTKFLEFTK